MKLKGLKRYWSGGSYYVYHRLSKTSLPAELPEDHPEFIAAYHAACSSCSANQSQKTETVQPNSVADVVRRYLGSHEFRKLSVLYQGVRRNDMKRLLATNGGAVGKVPFTAVRPEHIRHQMDSMSLNPANERLKSWSALGEFALKRNIVTVKPSLGISKIKGKPTQGHIPWTFAEIQKFRDYWPYGTEARLAFELQFWAGCRISDTVELGPANVDEEGWLVFVQNKTNSEVSVPFNRGLPKFAIKEDLDHLHRAIDAMGPRITTFMLTEFGLSRSAKGAASWFSERAQMAGLPQGRTSHGLRKSRMILHAERGANIHQIAAWSGHETLKEIERYTKRAERRRLLSPEPSVLETGKFLVG